MLQLVIPGKELYDERNNLFINTKPQVLTLEHSLVSISKWESKWKKPFLSKDSKTVEETIDYIRCMTISQNIEPNVYLNIGNDEIEIINKYIEDPMTATWFNEINHNKKTNEVITSEIIYYWMIQLNIPMECQKWHLNRLLTLIRVCSIKNTPPKKMNKREIMERNTALNETRKKALGTNG